MRANEEALVRLQSGYVDSVMYVFLSGMVLWGIYNVYRGDREKLSSVGMLFLYFLFTIQLVLLPIKYGQSVYPNNFHKVTELILDETLSGKIPRSENIWLLNEREGEIVFYFGDSQRVFVVQRVKVLNITIKQRDNVFKDR